MQRLVFVGLDLHRSLIPLASLSPQTPRLHGVVLQRRQLAQIDAPVVQRLVVVGTKLDCALVALDRFFTKSRCFSFARGRGDPRKCASGDGRHPRVCGARPQARRDVCLERGVAGRNTLSGLCGAPRDTEHALPVVDLLGFEVDPTADLLKGGCRGACRRVELCGGNVLLLERGDVPRALLSFDQAGLCFVDDQCGETTLVALRALVE